MKIEIYNFAMNRLIVALCLCIGLVGCDSNDYVGSNKYTANNENKIMSSGLFKVIEVEASGEVHEYLSRSVNAGIAFCHLPNCKYCRKEEDK